MLNKILMKDITSQTCYVEYSGEGHNIPNLLCVKSNARGLQQKVLRFAKAIIDTKNKPKI